MSPLSPGHYRDGRECAGISESWGSCQFIEASTLELEPLASRRFDDLELLIVHPDGCFLRASRDWDRGRALPRENHVWGLAEGPSESPAAATSRLEDLVEPKVDPIRRHLSIFETSKARRPR